jgi:hypothetical protein
VRWRRRRARSGGRLDHDRLREALFLHADEERRLGIVRPDSEVVDEERSERAATVRAWLDGAGLRVASSARKRRKCISRTSPTVTIPSRSRKAMEAPTSRS